jgi:VWFA-related protein
VRSCNSYPSRALLPFLLAGLLAASVAVSQEAVFSTGEEEPARSGLVERTRVDLALIEVVVVDRQGRHLRGLPSSAFRLLLGGTELPILSFDEIDLAGEEDPDLPPGPEARGESAGSGAEGPADTSSGEKDVASGPGREEEPADSGTLPAAADDSVDSMTREEIQARLGGPRWIVFLFDGYNNLAPRRLSAARRAAKRWLDDNLRPQDMVAVYEITPYLSSAIGFTNDVAALKDSIDKVRMLPGSPMGQDFVEQRLEQGDVPPGEFLESQLRNAGRFGNDLLRAERDQFYLNLTELSDVLSGLRGTKAVMLFSGGFPLTLTRATAAQGGFTPRFKDMLRSLDARAVRVFSYDIGEEGSFTDAEEAMNFRLALDQLGLGAEWMDTLQVGSQIDSTNAHHEILSVLGNETGGRFFKSRDFAAGLQAADDDLSHYYLIGFRPSSSILAGGRDYKRLKIELTEKPKGARVLSRRGQFAPEEREPERRAAASQAPAKPPGAASATAEQAKQPNPALVLACRPSFHPGGDGRTLVVLPIQVAGPIQGVAVGTDEMVLDFDVAIRATRGDEVVAEGERTVRLDFPMSAAARLNGGVQLREALLLPPGKLELTAELRLNGLDRSGSWTATADVPARDPARFGLTDLTLLYPVENAPLVYDVFRKGEAVAGTDPPVPLPDPLGTETAGRPAFYVEGAISRNMPLLVQTRVTAAPPPAPDRQSPLALDWELIPAAGGEPIAPPVQYRKLQMIGEGAFLEVLIDLDLRGVQPGEYRLRLTARNLVGEGEDVRSAPVSITP